MDGLVINFPPIVSSPTSDEQKRLKANYAEFSALHNPSIPNLLSKEELSTIDSTHYFGFNARKDFFDKFQKMKKNRLLYTGQEANLERDSLSRGFSTISLIAEHSNFSIVDQDLVSKSTTNFYSSNSPALHILRCNRNSTPTLASGSFSVPSLFDRSSVDDHFDIAERVSRIKVGSRSSVDTLQVSIDPDNSTSELEVVVYSPRTKYLGACIRENITPIAKLVIRKDKTTTLNLSHFAIRDKVGRIVSDYLEYLPEIECVDMSNNNFTDNSLPELIDSFSKITTLRTLNISQNKIDEKASIALADYLANPLSPLNSLILQNSDIDDSECARFIECLKTNKHLRELDMSSNNIGQMEIFQGGVMGKKFNIGAKSIAEYIASSDCRLSTLKLGWNSIKMASSLEMAKALKLNQTLLHLDLSYNGLGQSAGEYLGEALQDNQTLQTLMLESNQFNGTAVYCICVGILENTSLTRISLDKNPIGEFGANSIIQIPVAIGNRAGLTAVGCNTKLREASINQIFNFSDLLRDYSLHLDQPFERTIALWLLRKMAQHSNYAISKCAWEHHNKQQVINLVLSSHTEGQVFEELDEQHKAVIRGLHSIKAAASDRVAGIKLFEEADEDHGGTIDKIEFAHIMTKLGFALEFERIEDIYRVFDLECTGTLDKEEFLKFLSMQAQESEERACEMCERYFYAEQSSDYQRYVPPTTGILHITVVDNYSEKGPKNILSSLQASYMIGLASKVGNVSLICDVIQHYKLRYNEALKVYRVIHSESGNMAVALSKILPRMALVAESRNLLNKIVANDPVKLATVKKVLGSAYQPLLGNLNGYYHLNLQVDTDRLCLSQLLGHSKSLNAKRSKELSAGFHHEGKIGDTSQKGNWSFFRNEMLNREPVIISQAAFTPMPRSGILEFDFASGMRPSPHEVTITDFGVVRVLHNLGIIDKVSLYDALRFLGDCKEYTMKAEKKFAQKIYETPMEKACKIGKFQEILYNHLTERGGEYKKALKREILTTDVHTNNAQLNVIRRMRSMRSMRSYKEEAEGDDDDDARSDTSSAKSAWGASSKSLFPQKADKMAKAKKIKSIRGLPMPHAMSYYDLKAELERDDDEIPSHILEMKKRIHLLVKNESIPDSVKAQRIVEAILDTFSRMNLRCRHLVLLIKYFKYGNIPRVSFGAANFGSYNAEIVVALFIRILDLHNFEIVINELSAEDCAAVYCRIGWLHVFNPCKVDGGYELQLARREERIIVKILVTLSVVEPCQNISHQEFQWERSVEPIPGWELTNGWTTNEGIPVRGLLRLRFNSYSLDQTNTNNINATASIMSLTEKKYGIVVNSVPEVDEALSEESKLLGQYSEDHFDKYNSQASNSEHFMRCPTALTQRRIYKVDRDLRRVLTYTCLVDEIDMHCEGEVPLTRGHELIDSAKTRKPLWQFIYPTQQGNASL